MKAVRWVAGILVVVLLIVISLPFLIDANRFRPMLESKLTDALGRQVKVGNLKLSLLSGGVSADDLSVAGDPAFGPAPLVQAKSFHVGVELVPLLLHRKLVVTAITLDQPDIALLQNAAGEWNTPRPATGAAKPVTPAPTPESASAPLDLTVNLVKISNCRLSIGRTSGHWKPLEFDQMNLEIHDFSSTSAFPFSFSARLAGGGSVKLEGKAGPLNTDDVMTSPLTFTLKVGQVDLAACGLNDAAPDVAGVVSLDGSGTSSGQTAHVESHLKIDKLKLARHGTSSKRTVELDLAADHDLRHHSGVIRRGDIHLGQAVSHLSGTYTEQGEAVVLKMTFTGPDMAVQELEELLPPLGIVLPAGSSLQGGSVTANFSMEGPADRLVTTGSLGVNKTRLTGFDLSKRMSAIEKLAGINAGPDTEIETLGATVRVGPEGLTAQNIRLVVPAMGELNGQGTVSPANELAFQIAATVHASGLLSVAGASPIPIRVEGTSSNPIFKPDLKAIAGERVKSLEGTAGGFVRGLFGKKK